MGQRNRRVLATVFIVMIFITQVLSEGSKQTVQRKSFLSELVSVVRTGRQWYLHRDPSSSATGQDDKMYSLVENLLGRLKRLTRNNKAPPFFRNRLDKNRLSSFLYNISTYLQGAGGEPRDEHQLSDQEQSWEKVLHSLLQLDEENTFWPWDERPPPRPSFKLQDLFLSLRGSPHWNSVLGFVQAVKKLLKLQQEQPVLTFISQHWKVLMALLETALQIVVSGTYGQASAGVQGFICVLKGQDNCDFNTAWLQPLMTFLESQNWKPVVSLHSALEDGEYHGGSQSYGRVRPFSVLPGLLKEGGTHANKTQKRQLSSVQSLLYQALSRSNARLGREPEPNPNPALAQGIDRLRRSLLHRVGSSVYSSLRQKVARVNLALRDEVDIQYKQQSTSCSVGDLRQLILWGIKHNLTWNAQALGFSTQGVPSRPHIISCTSSREMRRTSRRVKKLHLSDPHVSSDDPVTAEILEAACNESISGLTGVSNFTVFLYCNLFDGGIEALDPEMDHVGPDLHATCSDAAWYLSAAEDDLLWVRVCSELFAHEFNNTVCANTSFWMQRSHMSSSSKDYQYLVGSNIDDLCLQLTSNVSQGVGFNASKDCLLQLGARSLSVEEFEGSWAARYCSKVVQNSSQVFVKDCDYIHWKAEQFQNSTLLELCMRTAGLKEHICDNVTLHLQLSIDHTWLLQACADPVVKPEHSKCFMQRVFDMLPAPYDFDTSQLCENPASFLVETLVKLNHCEGDPQVGWLATVTYVLRVLDFVVGLSAGLEEGEREVRQGLSQAILLSSLLDNVSFWASLQPNASLSVLQTVGFFLKKEKNASVKEDLLSCFSPILWELIQSEDNATALKVLFQEYLQMPRERIRALLMSAEKEAVKRFLSHMHQSWDQLEVEASQVSQKEQQAMETMTSAFIHKLSRVTPDLFVDLSQFIPFMSVSDIMTFPTSLMINDSVLMVIRDHSAEMKSPQKRAFVKRFLQSKMFNEISVWPSYLLSSILPLLPYLPIYHFQQLTYQQLSPLVEVLGNSSLDAIRGRHILRTIFKENRNLTKEDISRLGILLCYLNPDDVQILLSVSWPPVSLLQQLAMCISEGFTSRTGRLAHWLVMAVQSLNVSALPHLALTSLRGLLPRLGTSFLQSVPTTQLLDLMSQPGLPAFPPAQAFRILKKLTQETNLRLDTLCSLRPLLSGIFPSVLSALSKPTLWEEPHCQCWSSLLSELSPAKRAILQSTFQEALERISGNFTLHLQCLLPFISIRALSVTVDGMHVLEHSKLYSHLPWSHQQAQLLFNKIGFNGNITTEAFINLGYIAKGISCRWLRHLASQSNFPHLVQFLTELPGGMTPALRKCVVEELQLRLKTDLNILPPSFSITLPVTMMERLSNTSLIAVLEHLWLHMSDFLQLPRHKQAALVEKAVSVLGFSQEHGISGEMLDLLGPITGFLDRDMIFKVDREALKLRLDEMKGYCLPQDVMTEIARILKEKEMLGVPSSWTTKEIEHAGRLLFGLSAQDIGLIPLDALNAETVEQVLESQKRWEDSDIGHKCNPLQDYKYKRDNLVRGIVQGSRKKGEKKDVVPSCVDIKGTFPSAWRATQLGHMRAEELRLCVEDLGQDDSLSPDQRRALWAQLRQVYGPAKSLSLLQTLELGCIVTEMSERELQEVNLANLGIMAQFGSLKGWSPKKMRAAALSFLHHNNLKLEELGPKELASFGNLICGLNLAEINRLDSKNLSMAILFLRELVLPCSEHQVETLTSQLARSQAFGPVNSWGPEIFTEIGNLAAGLEDIILSSLVKEQIEGLTPDAIALIPPKKLSVVFNVEQLSWLNTEQASSITEEQWEELGSKQKQSVTLALYEGEVHLDYRGNNSASTIRLTSSLIALIIFCYTL